MNTKRAFSPDCLTDDEIALVLNEASHTDLIEKAANHLNDCNSCIQRLEKFSIRKISDSMRPIFDASLEFDSDTVSLNDETLVPSSIARSAQSKLPSINGYELTEVLGRGGMGVVYRARQKGLNRNVAIKMISGGIEAGPERIARFCREAETLARVNHPNVIRIYETGQSAGHPFFAMELVPGKNLAQNLDGTPWTNESAAKLTVVTANAIHAVHQSGIIHRDLKPSNILLNDSSAINNEFSSIRITDFGLAKPTWQAELTATGQAMGTPAYLSPEQALGKHDQITPATDVYSIGCVLYELLAGRPPLVASTMAESLRLITDNEPVSPRSLNPSVNKDLATICLHCLHKNPERRYHSAEALSDDLQRYLAGETIFARPVSWPEKIWKASLRKPALAAATVIATILAVGFLGSLLVFTNKLARSKSVAEANSKIAKTNFNRAHQAARKYLDNSIQHTPEASSKNLLSQKQLMENGISFYEALLVPDIQEIPEQDKKQQIAIRNELSQFFFEYSKVLRFLMEKEAAINVLETAIKLCDGTQEIAAGADPQSRKLKASIAVARARELASSDGEIDKALAGFENALECFKQLEKNKELNPDYLNWYRSVIHKSVGDLLFKNGDRLTALARIKLAEGFSSKTSKLVPDFQLTNSKVKLSLAKMYRQLGENNNAVSKTNEAIAIINQICEASSPPRIIYEEQRVDCHEEIAECYLSQGQNTRALVQLDKAIKYQKNLVALHDENESLLLGYLHLLETKFSWVNEKDSNAVQLVENIDDLRRRLNSVSNDPAKKLINIKLQIQAADRENYRNNLQSATKYYNDALNLMDSLPEDYEPEIQLELKSGLLFRLAEKSFALNDYVAARQRAAEYLARANNHSVEMQTILAVSAAMTGDLDQASKKSSEIDWSNENALVFNGRQLLIELISNYGDEEYGKNVHQRFRDVYLYNLDRGNGNQFFKEDLCRAVEWLQGLSEDHIGYSMFIEWAKETAIQILVDESIPKFSDGARTLGQDVRFKCLKNARRFDELIEQLNNH